MWPFGFRWQTKSSQLYINRNFAQKSATEKVWPFVCGIRNFMNTWSQQQHNNYTNLLLTGYECKPVKIAILRDMAIFSQCAFLRQWTWPQRPRYQACILCFAWCAKNEVMQNSGPRMCCATLVSRRDTSIMCAPSRCKTTIHCMEAILKSQDVGKKILHYCDA